MTPPEHRPLVPGTVLEGADLRHVLYVLLQRNDRQTVGQLVLAIEALGFSLRSARPAKQVSDLLGREVRRGRFRRVARATYQLDPTGISRTTLWRARVRVADGRALGGARPVDVRDMWNGTDEVREMWNGEKREGPCFGGELDPLSLVDRPNPAAGDRWGHPHAEAIVRFLEQHRPTRPAGEREAGDAQVSR